MKKFRVDYTMAGSVIIEAETRAEADEKFSNLSHKELEENAGWDVDITEEKRCY